MFRTFAAVAAAIGFLGLAIAGAPAQAAVNTPGNLTVGGVKYSWFGTPANGGDCTTDPLCANTNVVANITNTGIELRPITGVLVGVTPADLSLTIMIESLTGAPINSFGLTSGGTLNGSTGANIYSQTSVLLGATTAAVSTSSNVALSTASAGTKVFASIDSRGNNGSITFVGISVTTVPEPATMALFATGVLGLAALRRRRAAD